MDENKYAYDYFFNNHCQKPIAFPMASRNFAFPTLKSPSNSFQAWGGFYWSTALYFRDCFIKISITSTALGMMALVLSLTDPVIWN